jgi:plasmid stabilization system protein ParE
VSYSLHPEAEAELTVAAAFYKQQAGVALGSAFVEEFTRVAGLLVGNPGLGTPAEGELRVYPLRRFPYSLVYRVVGTSVRILVVGHQHRRPGYWRSRV